jgi:mannose-1-phosphate guanylyltransferase
MRVLAIVLAGGQGQRFWPRSSEQLPKQFLRLLGEESLLQATVARLERLIPPDDVHVVTSQTHEGLVRKHLPHLPWANVIAEPLGRDTAAATGYALTLINEPDPDAVVMVLPADHHICDVAAWAAALDDACRTALRGCPVLIGIRPERPETAYGYLLLGEDLPDLAGRAGTRFARVVRFVEKPEVSAAHHLLASGRCLWNSGMFVFKVSTALDLIRRHLPGTYAGLREIARLRSAPGAPPLDSAAWRGVSTGIFSGLQPISIDYGLMEKERDLVAGRGEFGWDDVGTWEGLGRLRPSDDRGNVVRGPVVLKDSENCIIDWTGGPAVIIGLRDMVIAGGAGPLLACSRDKLGDLKTVLTGRQFSEAATRSAGPKEDGSE